MQMRLTYNTSVSETALLDRLKSGDEQSLEQLFKTYYNSLVRFAMGIIKDQSDAEDAVQQVFVKLWENREGLSIHTAIKAYLYMAVKNTCFNRLKQQEKKYWLEDGMDDDIQFSVDNTMQQIHTKSLEKQIQQSLEMLPPKCGLIFKLSRFEEKSYKEIAEILNISVKTVENQMGKALQLMRESLKEHLTSIAIALSLFADKIFF
jgi:RNA polymerase sigma-70 factor (ECF subfamily)